MTHPAFPRSGRAWRAALGALALGLAAGCAALPLPGGGGRGGDAAMASLLENRVWLEQGAAVPGAARAWLASGELVTASCWEVPRLMRWRWTGATTLDWVDGGQPVRAEVAAVGHEELVLLIEERGVPISLRFRAAEGAQPC